MSGDELGERVRVGVDGLLKKPVEEHAAGRLAATREQSLAGGLTWRKASSLAGATAALTREQAGHVEARVLGAGREFRRSGS